MTSEDTAASTAVSRRDLLKGALVGTAAAGVVRAFDPSTAYAASATVFGFGVASGDPTLDSVIIWTRATPAPGIAPGADGGVSGYNVRWEVAADSAFANIVSSGVVPTSRDGIPTQKINGDYTVKIDVTGLANYTRYYYRFTALNAMGSTVEVSPVGRTQTMPDDGDVKALRFALVTCSNYTGGYFSAYRVIGQRNDLDFVMHVGDYIYEYGNTINKSTQAGDRYGPAQLAGTRDSLPAGDLIMLADYRLRHGVHKADPDTALAHQQVPWISIFDDHEVANNTWNAGAENHYTTGGNAARGIPAEGDFMARRAAAYQAYLEWMPFRYPVQPAQQVAHQGQQFFRKYRWGQLADLSLVETRQNRSGQINADGTMGYDNYPTTSNGGGGFVAKTTVASVDAANAGRHMPEAEQVSWLTDTVNKAGRPWHLVGNQVMFVPVNYPASVLQPGSTSTTVFVNSDQWDGYPANQSQVINILGSAPKSAGDTVLFTGDIHSSWASDIPLNQGTYVAAAAGNSAGTEFVTPSVTSDGFYEAYAASVPPPTAVALVRGSVTPGLQTANPWVRYFDGIGHGFTVVDVTPARVQCDYYLTPDPTTAQPEPRAVQAVVPAYNTSYQTLAGTRKVSAATGPVGPRADLPADASVAPPTALPEHVGPAAVAGVLAAGAFVAFSRRRTAISEG